MPCAQNVQRNMMHAVVSNIGTRLPKAKKRPPAASSRRLFLSINFSVPSQDGKPRDMKKVFFFKNLFVLRSRPYICPPGFLDYLLRKFVINRNKHLFPTSMSLWARQFMVL